MSRINLAFRSIWSTSVHSIHFGSIRSYSVHFDYIRSTRSYSVHSIHSGPIQPTLVLFGPHWSNFIQFGTTHSTLVLFGPIWWLWSYFVHLDPIWSALVLFGPIHSILVLFSPLCSIRSNSVISGPFCLLWSYCPYSIHFGPIWSYSVLFSPFSVIRSTLVLFGHPVFFGLIRSFDSIQPTLTHLVHFSPFLCTYIMGNDMSQLRVHILNPNLLKYIYIYIFHTHNI